MDLEAKESQPVRYVSLVQAAVDAAMGAAWAGRLEQPWFSEGLKRFCSQLEASQLLVWHHEAATGELRLVAWHGAPSPNSAGAVLRLDESRSRLAELLVQGAACLAAEELLSLLELEPGAVGPFCRAWVVPVTQEKQVIGLFCVIDPKLPWLAGLSQEEVGLLSSAWGLLLWFLIRPSRSVLLGRMLDAFAWRMDVRTRALLDIGEQAFALSGYGEEDWLQAPGFLTDHAPSEDSSRFEDMLNRCRREKAPQSAEHRVLRKSGEALWLRTEVHLEEHQAGLESFRGISLDITELKSGQQVIQSQLSFLQTVTESLGEGFAIIDRDTTIQFVNPAGLRILGATWSEVVGTKMTESVTAWTTEGRRMKVDEHPTIRALKEGQPVYEFQMLLPRKNGDLSTVSASGCPIYRDGQVIGAVAVFHDVTESVRAGRAIRAKAEQFEELLNSTYEGLAIHDAGRILYVNRALARMFGYEPEEMIGRHVLDFSAPESVPLLQAQIRSPSPAEEYEPVGVRKDGSRVTFRVHGHNVVFSGRVLRMESLQDVTAQVRQRQSLQLLARAGAALSSSLNLGATLEELAHIIVPALADWCMVDLLESSNVIRRVAVVHADPAKAAAAARLKDAARPKLSDPFGTGLTLREGRPLVGEGEEDASRRLMGDRGGWDLLKELGMRQFITLPLVARSRPVGVLTLVYCDEKRKYGPGEMVVAEELALRAALAIDNARLFEAERDAVKRREQVVEAVAHDLKNPLTSIKLSTELAASKPSHLKEALTVIRKSVHQMQSLIFDLLDLSKIDAGAASLSLEEVSVPSLLEDLVSTFHPLISEKRLVLTVDAGEPSVGDLAIDRSKSLQVLSNIVGNAVKFTPPGGSIRIQVSAFTQRMALFEVSDTGPGIDAGSLPYVFDRFWRKPEQRKHGAGLGLSIAKSIIEAQGGMIWVESQEGQGTHFFFTFPLAQASASSRMRGARDQRAG